MYICGRRGAPVSCYLNKTRGGCILTNLLCTRKCIFNKCMFSISILPQVPKIKLAWKKKRNGLSHFLYMDSMMDGHTPQNQNYLRLNFVTITISKVHRLETIKFEKKSLI